MDDHQNRLQSYLDLQLHNGSWNRRWFVLTIDGTLCFYKSAAAAELRGQIDVSTIVGSIVKPAQPPHNFVFSIELRDDVFLCVCADSEELRREWMNSLSGNFSDNQNSFQEQNKQIYETSQMIVSQQQRPMIPNQGGGVVHTGWLKKRSEVFRRWKPRFFVLGPNRMLTYYKDETMTEEKAIPLDHVHKMKQVDTKKYGQPYTFELVSASTTYALAANSEQDRDEWMAKIESTYPEVTKLVPLREGALIKRSNVRKRWKRRWFMLWGGWLFYFTTQEECEKFRKNSFFTDQVFRTAFNRYVKGAMELFKCEVKSIGKLDMFSDAFVISSDNRKLYLVADNLDEQNSWIDSINAAKMGSNGSQLGNNINMWTQDFTEPTMSLSSARSMSETGKVNSPQGNQRNLDGHRRFSTGVVNKRAPQNRAGWHSPGTFPFKPLRASFRKYGGSKGIIDLDQFITICRELLLDLDQERLEILFQLLDLDGDDLISFQDMHSTFHREQKNHFDLTPRELILQYITTHQHLHFGDGDASPSESFEDSDPDAVYRAVMIEGVPDFVRENDQFILELEQLIFKEYQPLQTEIVGEYLEIIFAYDIKSSDMKVMERDLKELLSEFARDRKERLATEKGLRVRALTAEELEDSMRYNKHLFEENAVRQEESEEEEVYEKDPEELLMERLTEIVRNINVSRGGYLMLSELLVFFAKLQGVPLKEVPLEHPVMRRLDGCSIPQAVQYLKSVEKHILHIPAMLEASRTINSQEAELARKYIEHQVFAENQEGSVTMTMTLGTDTLLEESFSE